MGYTLPQNLPQDINGFVMSKRLAPMKKRIGGEDYYLWKQKSEARRPCQELFDGYENASQSEIPEDIIQQMKDMGMSDEQIEQIIIDMEADSPAPGTGNGTVLNPINDSDRQITIEEMGEGLLKYTPSKNGYIFSLVKAQPSELSFIEPHIEMEEIEEGLYKFHNKTTVGIMGHDGEVVYHNLLSAPGAKGLNTRVVHWSSHDWGAEEGHWVNPQMLAGTGYGSGEASSGRKEYMTISIDPDKEADYYVDPTKVSDVRIMMNIYIKEKMGYHTVFNFKTNV